MITSRHSIYIGLNDAKSKNQEHSTERFLRILYNVCKGYEVSFSVSELHGGYFCKDSTFVNENSLCITLVGAEDALADEIAKDICAFFNQESVMVIRDNVECRFISEKLKIEPNE